MIFTSIAVGLICSALAFGAVVLIVINQFKDEPPSWESYLKNGVKHWKQIKK